MYAQIADSDLIVLESLDSFMAKRKIPPNLMPNELLILKDQVRYQLYSDIAQRVPRLAAYVLHTDMNTDYSQGIFKSLYNHCMDPVFVDLLMQQLESSNDHEAKSITGAFLVKIFRTYIEKHIDEVKPTTEDKPKKGEKPAPEPPKKTDMELAASVAHIHRAACTLLKTTLSEVITKCGNLDDDKGDGNALAIAACVAMNNDDTIREIYNMDLPVTAEVFNIKTIADKGILLRSALLLQKIDFAKTTKNQEAFITSLRKWVYETLNSKPTNFIYVFLMSVYNTPRPKVETNLINPMECGTMYSNLLIVAKQIINNQNQ